MIEFAKRQALAGALAAAVLLAFGPLAAAADKPYSVAVENAAGKVGADAAIKVTVTAADGWFANFRYAHRLDNLAAAGGAALAFKSVRASSAAGRTIVYTLAVRPTAPGVHKVTGDILFSLTRGKEVVTETLPLAATVTGDNSGS